MHTRINGICRGDGKIYVKLICDGLKNENTIGVECSSLNGTSIPCNVYKKPATKNSSFSSFIIVLPILSLRKASLLVNEVNKTGQQLSSQTLALYFAKAKWLSRFNYRFNKTLCEEIRDYDIIGSYDQATIEFWECIADTKQDILRGVIRLPFEPDSNVVLECLSQTLNTINVNPIFLSNCIVNTPIGNNVRSREIQFSIKLPHENQNWIFTVSDKNHPNFDSFEEIEQFEYSKLRKHTASIMKNAQIDPKYPEWFDQHKADLGTLAKQAETSFKSCPLFSIVVPLFKTPLNFFSEMLESVQKQSYGHWELILVNASPDDSALLSLIHRKVAEDARIKLILLEGNGGISENTNTGIMQASGDFVCFFDHDDILEPDILFEYAKAINLHEDIDVLYCDEDKLMPDGKLEQPFFKPNFSIDLLRSNNYICHMLTLRKSLLDRIKPNTSDFDGAQDHNMALQASEKARRIWHVQRVLYHWRISNASTAANAGSKPYATQAGIRAIQSHLKRLNVAATVTQSHQSFTYKVNYHIPTNNPLVSIIIPTKDHVDVLDTCIRSIIQKSSYKNYEIILVENNSTEPKTFDYYAQLEREHSRKIRVEYWPAEFNFSKLMNYGISKAAGDYLLLLNNDTEVITPNWIETMLGICARDEVGVVGARLYYRDETIQHAGLCITGGVAGHLNRNQPKNNWGYFALADATQNLSAVTAACMMTKRCVFEKVGGWSDELAIAFNDVDYCLKAREEGYLVVYSPDVELFHYESLSRGFENNDEKRLRFHKEASFMNYHWAKYYIKGDPYINSNLTTKEPFNLYYHL